MTGAGVGTASPIVSISLKDTRRFSSIARLERITAVELVKPTSKFARGRLPLRTSLRKLSSCVSTGLRSSCGSMIPFSYSQLLANFASRVKNESFFQSTSVAEVIIGIPRCGPACVEAALAGGVVFSLSEEVAAGCGSRNQSAVGKALSLPSVSSTAPAVPMTTKPNSERCEPRIGRCWHVVMALYTILRPLG